MDVGAINCIMIIILVNAYYILNVINMGQVILSGRSRSLWLMGLLK